MSDSQDYIASVLAKHSWNIIGINDPGTLGGIKPNTPLTVSYSFLTGRPDYYSGDYGDDFLNFERGVIPSEVNNFSILSVTQQGVFNQSIAAWSSVANITFTPAQSGQVGDIAIANVKLQSDLAVTSSPGQVTALGVGGDIFINPNSPLNSGLNRGDVGYMTILHELGHALGLEHPIPYNTGDVGPFLTENANTKYSVMVKYDAKFGTWWTPSKPMLYDILAIQTLYGVQTTTNAGDGSSYAFKTGADAIQAIWDAGGSGDVIDAFDQTQAVTIDLRPGHFSFVGASEESSQQQIAIAYQVAGQEGNWIENAIGGSGKDTLIGNDADNELTGGGGSDILKGGIGDDTYVYHSGDGFDTIEDIDGTNKITVDGIDLSLDGGNKYGIDVWLSADKKYQFVLSPANALGQRDLTITNTSETTGKVSLKITNFHDGDFGLSLPQNPSVYIALVPTQEILGDLAPQDFNAAQPGIQTQTDSLGNIITLPGTPEPSRVDTLYGSALGDHIAGKLGEDILDGKGVTTKWKVAADGTTWSVGSARIPYSVAILSTSVR